MTHRSNNNNNNNHSHGTVHLALITANAIFGFGSVIGALGLPATNPLVFTFVREILSGTIQLFLAAVNNWRDRKTMNTTSHTSPSTRGSVAFESVDDQATRSMSLWMKDETESVIPLLDSPDNASSQVDNGKEEKKDNKNNNNSNEKDDLDESFHHSGHHHRQIGNTKKSTSLYPVTLPHVRQFALLGLLLFGNQAAYIVGIQLAGPVTGSIWQPSAPIFTCLISMILWRLEPLCWKRMSGVLLAFAGCAGMVLFSSESRKEDAVHGGSLSYVLGNLLFATNCLCTAFFILCSKRMLQLYQALVVVGWSYIGASIYMFVAAFISSYYENIICPLCQDRADEFWSYLHIPAATWPALAYYILGMSVGSWSLILWANQSATGTLVVGYSVVQPMASLLTTVLVLVAHWIPSCASLEDTPENSTTLCLNPPVWGTLLGMGGVFAGLALVVFTEPQRQPANNNSSNQPINSQPINGTKEEYGTFLQTT